MKTITVPILFVCITAIIFLGCAHYTLETVQMTNDQAVLAKIALGNNDRSVRHAAAEKLTDQTLLVKVATEGDDWVIRETAVENITDQAVLKNIEMNDKEEGVCEAAVKKLTDQAALAEIVLADKNFIVCMDAVRKLTDEQLLEKVVTEDKTLLVRLEAIKNITGEAFISKLIKENKDEIVRNEAKRTLKFLELKKTNDKDTIIKMAIEAEDFELGLAALARITDETDLTKIVLGSVNSFTRGKALDRITNQELLAKIASKSRYPLQKAIAVTMLNDTNSILNKLAGNIQVTTRNSAEFIARVKLFLQEPGIKTRFPRLESLIKEEGEGEQYYDLFTHKETFYIHGEKPSIKLSQDNQTLALQSWSSSFPEKTSYIEFIPAVVKGEELFEKFFHQSDFTPNDLLNLSRSGIPEVRAGALLCIVDQATLASAVKHESDINVRFAAVRNLTDEVLLSDSSIQSFVTSIAIENYDPKLRQSAIAKLTNQAVLAKAADEDTNWEVRLAAVKRLTDETLLGKIAKKDDSLLVRRAAKEKLKELTGKK